MLVDIVQTFDEQAFDDQRYPGKPGQAGTRDVMSAIVMGPAMPRITTSSTRPNRARVIPARIPAAPATGAGPARAAHLSLTTRGRIVLWVLAALVVATVTFV